VPVRGGLLMFFPAAVSGKYALFLVALFAVGCSLAILETAANPFVAQFGPAATSEQRLNFAQAFNPPGTILGCGWAGHSSCRGGVDAGAGGSAKGAGRMRRISTERSCGWCRLHRAGFGVLLFALLLSRMRFPTIASEHEGDQGGHGSFRALLHYPQLWFAVAATC